MKQAQRPKQDWQEGAACTRHDPELFFPDSADASAQARGVCQNECPDEVATACLAYAMRYREDHGIWGGLTARQRRSLRRRLASRGVS